MKSHFNEVFEGKGMECVAGKLGLEGDVARAVLRLVAAAGHTAPPHRLHCRTAPQDELELFLQLFLERLLRAEYSDKRRENKMINST